MSEQHTSEPGTWNEWWEKEQSSKAHNELLACVHEIMDGQIAGGSFLEVGGGSSLDSMMLARMGGDCTMLDFSEKSIVKAVSLAEQQGIEMACVRGDAKEMPFKDDSFDVVFSQGLIEHYEPPDALIKEQVRVVKPGGFVLIDVPQLISLQAVVKKGMMEMGKWPFGWERNYTESQLKAVLSESELEFVTSYGYGVLPFVGLGIRTRINKALGEKQDTQFQDEVDIDIPNDNSLQNSWIARHLMNNIGVVGRKPL